MLGKTTGILPRKGEQPAEKKGNTEEGGYLKESKAVAPYIPRIEELIHILNTPVGEFKGGRAKGGSKLNP